MDGVSGLSRLAVLVRQLQGFVSTLNARGLLLVVATTQNVGATTTVQISSAAAYDPGGDYAAGVYTVPATGIYRVHGWIELQNSAADKNARMEPLVNGAATVRLVEVWKPVAAGNVSGAGFLTQSFAAGDTISAQITNGDAGARNISWRLVIERMT